VPIAGSLSDFTTSRFGKRKGYIIAGATFDLVFIAGLALISMSQPEGWDGSALGSPILLVTFAQRAFSLTLVHHESSLDLYRTPLAPPLER
jgi:hypothetical protein